jgi:hypothetical protein
MIFRVGEGLPCSPSSARKHSFNSLPRTAMPSYLHSRSLPVGRDLSLPRQVDIELRIRLRR